MIYVSTTPDLSADDVRDIVSETDPGEACHWRSGGVLDDDVAIGTYHASAHYIFTWEGEDDASVFTAYAVPEFWHEHNMSRGAASYILAIMNGEVSL